MPCSKRPSRTQEIYWCKSAIAQGLGPNTFTAGLADYEILPTGVALNSRLNQNLRQTGL
jgi:hypothetical protein